MDRDQRATAAVLPLLLLVLGAPCVRAEGFAGRSDAPAKPEKGEYGWAEPKDWIPPTLQELEAQPWTEGRVVKLRDLARARAAESTPPIGETEALSLKNDSLQANEKILSILGRMPKNDGEVDWDATVNRWAGGAPNTLNYVLLSAGVEESICRLIYAGLFTFDHKFVPMADGDTVLRWRHGTTAELVTLRDDLVWEDGTPFTAYDAEFSYHLILDERINVPAMRFGPDQLWWVKAYDARTLAIFHKAPLATNVWNADFPVLPKHVYSPGLAEDPTMVSSEWNVYWNQHPLSSGPYTLKEHHVGESVLLERRDSYYLDKSGKAVRDKPYIKQIRFRIIPDDSAALLAFKKGELDEKGLNARQWMRETDDADFVAKGVKVNGEDWGITYIAWGQRSVPEVPFFKDKRVRWAMTYALNHKEMLEKLFFGLYEPGAGNFHPHAPWANPEVKPIEQDLDKAEALLDEAGWTDSDGDGVRDKMIDGKRWKFEFTIGVPQGSPGDSIATLLKQDLDNIGVRMNIRVIEWATFSQAQVEHRFDAMLASWGVGTDPDTGKNVWKTSEYAHGRNFVGYSNPEVDRLYDEGERELDTAKRWLIYRKIQKVLVDDQPYTFLLFRRSFCAFSKRLRGYQFSPRGPFGYAPGFLGIWVAKSPG